MIKWMVELKDKGVDTEILIWIALLKFTMYKKNM